MGSRVADVARKSTDQAWLITGPLALLAVVC